MAGESQCDGGLVSPKPLAQPRPSRPCRHGGDVPGRPAHRAAAAGQGGPAPGEARGHPAAGGHRRLRQACGLGRNVGCAGCAGCVGCAGSPFGLPSRGCDGLWGGVAVFSGPGVCDVTCEHSMARLDGSGWSLRRNFLVKAKLERTLECFEVWVAAPCIPRPFLCFRVGPSLRSELVSIPPHSPPPRRSGTRSRLRWPGGRRAWTPSLCQVSPAQFVSTQFPRSTSLLSFAALSELGSNVVCCNYPFTPLKNKSVKLQK